MPLLHPHNPAWQAEFSQLREVYFNALGPLALRIEHVGSTAVPDLLAKPILDIDIVIASYREFPGVTQQLATLGYAHNGDQGIPQREAFRSADANTPRTTPTRAWMNHHLYVCPQDSPEFRRHIWFRDALRASTETRRQYEKLKIAIAEKSSHDRNRYSEIKEAECRAFIEELIATWTQTVTGIGESRKIYSDCASSDRFGGAPGRIPYSISPHASRGTE